MHLMLLLNLLLLGSISVKVGAQVAPGIYIDNGLDQTAIDHEMSDLERQDIELDILNLLGLQKRPQRSSKSLKKSAPKFLLDIYKSLMDKENGDEEHRSKRSTDDSDLKLTGEEQNAIEESDVIMTFESISHHVSEVRHERGKRLWFNVSEMPIAENVVGAELRIYQNNVNSAHLKKDAVYTVTVYELVNTDSGERELEFVSAVNTTGHFTGWLKLNLTGCLPTWVAFPNSNKGLYLSVHSLDKPGREIRPEDIGLVTVKGEDEAQPFMVAFLKAVNHVKSRRRRSVSPPKTRVKKAAYSPVLPNDAQQHSSGRSCRLHTLYINFRDLKWHDWIIAPEGYAAYYCAGECNFPLNSHLNATNHAIVQTLVHLVTPLRFPKPCCAPTKVTPISVLYFLDDNNVILKKYKKMVVKSCGCL